MGQEKTYESDFVFWGRRNYVHSSHMVCQLLDAVKTWELGKIDIMAALFHLKLREHGTYYLLDRRLIQDRKKIFNATFKLAVKSHKFHVGLKGNGKALDVVIPDDENELILSGVIIKDKKVATIRDFSVERFINVIIALNKKLHYETITSKGFGSWFTAQLNLKFQEIDFSQSRDVMVRLVHNIGNIMTKSVIQINGIKCGEISFKREALL